jgi:hypothetical protein
MLTRKSEGQTEGLHFLVFFSTTHDDNQFILSFDNTTAMYKDPNTLYPVGIFTEGLHLGGNNFTPRVKSLSLVTNFTPGRITK